MLLCEELLRSMMERQSVLQCVAVCCSVLQCAELLRLMVERNDLLQYVAVFCSVLQRVAARCSVLQCV